MNCFKLLFLSCGLTMSSAYLFTAAAEERKEEMQSLDEAVATTEQELKPRFFGDGKKQIEFTPDLYQLSAIMKHASENEPYGLINLASKRSPFQTNDSYLQETYDLLSAVSQKNLAGYLEKMSMNQLLKTIELSSYLYIKKEEQDITDIIAQCITKKTIETSLDKSFSMDADNSPILNEDLETLLKKTFDADPERFKHIQPGIVLHGHNDAIYGLAWSPDSKNLASGSYDGTIKIWDPATGKNRRMLNGDRSMVTSVAWSPDGKTLASGSWDDTIKIWDPVVGGREIRTLRGHRSMVRGVAWSPDNKTLASGSGDKTIKLWDSTTGQVLKTLGGHTESIKSVIWSPDGKMLASGSADKTIKIWDVATGTELRTLRGHMMSISSVTWSPDGRMLASGSDDNTIKIWNPITGELLKTLNGHTQVVIGVVWSPDGKNLASGSYDGTIKIWDVATGQELSSFSAHILSFSTLAWSPDGETIASGSTDREIRLWIMPSMGDKLLAKMYKIAQVELNQETQPEAEHTSTKQKAKRLKLTPISLENSSNQVAAAAAAIDQNSSDDSDFSDEQMAQTIANSLEEQAQPAAASAIGSAEPEQQPQPEFFIDLQSSIHEEKNDSD